MRYSKGFASAYYQFRSSLSGISREVKGFLEQKKSKALESFRYVDAKSKMILNVVKDSFNEISQKAQMLLDVEAFTKERIAEQLNDIKVMKAFGEPDVGRLAWEIRSRFWDELDAAVKKGMEAELIPVDERTHSDGRDIRFGKWMKAQKEQSLFAAEGIQNELKSCCKKMLPYNEVVERLARTYNNESMAYRLRTMDGPIKNYNDLSTADKALCQSVVKDLLHTMPSLEEGFLENEKTLNDERDVEIEKDIFADVVAPSGR